VGDIEQTMMDDQLHGALEKLTDLQREVLSLRFGLNGSTPLSLQATATKMDIGVRRVRRAEEEALALLRADNAVIAARESA
jgi:DNA-directed RNA polymerase sigma subunit (sigma70/sigma32)